MQQLYLEYSIVDVGAFTWVNFALSTIKGNSRDALGRAKPISVRQARPAPRSFGMARRDTWKLAPDAMYSFASRRGRGREREGDQSR